MWLVKYSFLILCLLTMRCHSLTCRTEGGPRESELKNIYTKCLKMQDVKYSSNVQSFNDQDRKESRDNGQRYDWNKNRALNEERKRRRNDETYSNNSKRDNNDDGSSSDEMDNRSDRTGNKDRRNSRRDKMMSNRGDQNENDRFNNNDFQNNQYDSYMSHYNGYYSSTQSPRRYRREKRIQNSGKRSQYNPNTRRSYENTSRNDDKNSSQSNSNVTVDSKACAMHCFLENLEMTGEDGLPDRYLVTQALTKHVTNDDLHDFLQESIEECFQILDNENTEEKCEFSKNLLMCLSEKGRSNCDDWKDDLKLK